MRRHVYVSRVNEGSPLSPFPELAELPDEKYPLLLTTDRTLYHFHTSTMTRRVAGLDQLNDRAGAHGVGRLDVIEDRLVGIKSREVYEAPGAITLHAAREALELIAGWMGVEPAHLAALADPDAAVQLGTSAASTGPLERAALPIS